MKLVEKILAIAAFTGLLLMFSLISGGTELFMLSLLSLSGIYFALGFLLFNQIRLRDVTKKETFANLTTIQIVFGVITGIVLSIICVGALFKFLKLPGSNEMLMLGVFFSILILIGVLVMRRKLAAAPILIRTIILGAAGAVLFFTSELTLVKLQYRNHPRYIDAYSRYKEEPGHEALRDTLELEYNRVWMSEEEFIEYKSQQ